MKTIRYATSFLTAYLKGEIRSEQNFIQFKVPNTVLGLIPLGSKKRQIPVNQISSVTTGFRINWIQLVIGIVFAAATFVATFSPETKDIMLVSKILGILISLTVSACLAVNALDPYLVISTTSGRGMIIHFLIFDRAKAELAADEINSMIGERMSDTNVREQTDRVVDAIRRK